MSAPVVLNQSEGSKTVNLGKPYRYDIYGIAGRIELGNKANGAVVENGVFKKTLVGGLFGGLITTNTTVESATYVKLQTGLTNCYPESLSVSGTSPGTSVGPVQKYGPNWTLSDPKHPVSVSLSFHAAGSSLLGSLLPGILSPAYYNQNPTGYFYVLGVCHLAPPEMTGTLNFSSNEILMGYPITIDYTIKRHEDDVYRPPFLGADLGAVNLTVLGTPPSSSGSSPQSAPAPTPTTGNGTSVNVVIDPNSSSGPGWTRVALNL